ncbi:MAG: hypothetical protein TE42_03510 [Candidatus Synechococcus spongiarum SP3]|uniref:Uncharacterized protein n=1 Tax=Candidatus Synechococcus spongiarum SP3 TaxID=1604020 RepID=A0A0G2HLV6_9SYNE|nr:MAG: hypothetical protein TE42_03510 [Candidatus Synechococcus spongiarum SP3]
MQASLSQERRFLRSPWGDDHCGATHRQLFEQAIAVEHFVSQQRTKGQVADPWRYNFALVGLSG